MYLDKQLVCDIFILSNNREQGILETDTGSHKKQAFSGLVKIFMPYIQKRASRISLIGMAHDDIVQEGLIGLFDAIEGYDEGKGASFETFAIVCIDNRIYSAFRQAAAKKNALFSDYLSLSEGGDDVYTFPRLPSIPSPEEIVILREELNAALAVVNENLSAFEKRVLGLYLEGYGYIAIAELLHISPKSVDNALQRARKKIKQTCP